MVNNPLAQDLDAVLNQTRALWEELRGSRVFITGGSGFFGCWMLESLASANERLRLDMQAVVLTRQPVRFGRRLPHLAADPAIELLKGDVRESDAPGGQFTHLVHIAAEPHGPRYAEDPAAMLEVMVGGTRRVLEFAQSAGVGRLLLISSGAVYGPQPDCDRIPEDAERRHEPDPARRAYGEGKRAIEGMARDLPEGSGPAVFIARPFAFLGPYLPLDAGFAASRFISDALAGGPVRVIDGAVVRSYLYAADLTSWLWTILLRGEPGRAYNVGSEHAVTLTTLAALIAGSFRPPPIVERALGTSTANRYVPSTERARAELGVAETVPLPEAVRRTVRWQRETTRATAGH